MILLLQGDDDVGDLSMAEELGFLTNQQKRRNVDHLNTECRCGMPRSVVIRQQDRFFTVLESDSNRLQLAASQVIEFSPCYEAVIMRQIR